MIFLRDLDECECCYCKRMVTIKYEYDNQMLLRVHSVGFRKKDLGIEGWVCFSCYYHRYMSDCIKCSKQIFGIHGWRKRKTGLICRECFFEESDAATSKYFEEAEERDRLFDEAIKEQQFRESVTGGWS